MCQNCSDTSETREETQNSGFVTYGTMRGGQAQLRRRWGRATTVSTRPARRRGGELLTVGTLVTWYIERCACVLVGAVALEPACLHWMMSQLLRAIFLPLLPHFFLGSFRGSGYDGYLCKNLVPMVIWVGYRKHSRGAAALHNDSIFLRGRGRVLDVCWFYSKNLLMIKNLKEIRKC